MNTKHARNPTRERHGLALELCEIKVRPAKSGDAVTFSGYGSVWNNTDAYGDTIHPGAFSDALKQRKPMMFFGHNPGRVPGKWISAQEDSKGLLLDGELTPGHSEAADLAASLKHGSLNGLSIGGYTVKATYKETDGEISGRDIQVFDLWEVSPVSMPAENDARIDLTTVKTMLDECDSLLDMEDLLREAAGFSKSTATAFVARFRRICRGEPGGQRDAKAAQELNELFTAVQGATFPTSLLGDPK